MDLFGATLLWFMVGLLGIGLIAIVGFLFADFINKEYPNHKIDTEEPSKTFSFEFFEYFSRFFYLGVLGIICMAVGLMLLPLVILFFPVIWTARKVHQRQKRHGNQEKVNG